MTIELRHYCRHDRTKLAEPMDNLHRAFCCRGCFDSFYRSRCVVCETKFRRKTERQRTCIDRKCKAELRRFPLAYSWPETAETANTPQNAVSPPSEAHFTGTFLPLRPRHKCLREWSWDGDIDGDLSLYDKDGLTIARIVLVDGRWHLRSPVMWPSEDAPKIWPSLEKARRAAESLALTAIPLAGGINIERRELALINAANTTPNSMGPPLNRQASREDAIPSDWKPVNGADMPDIPDFLRRT